MQEWTEEEISIAIEMKKAGHTMREIATRIGRTRNAVIGRMSRCGLSEKRPANTERRRSDAPPATCCQWPIGNPGDENFHFCADGVRHGKPYCETHFAIAYRKPKRWEKEIEKFVGRAA